ncbi:MAG: sterol desaturase family protein [Chitinophagales bacterium]|nr:sterol desaturase family protein [Chitinophagales bacterium]MDW8418249.1 sterol desaturase family protein [Chitinophagales bacterium]
MRLYDIINDEVTRTVGLVLGTAFFVCIVLEFILSHLMRKGYVRTEYAIINLSVALLQQVTDFIHKGIFIYSFAYVQTHWSLQKCLHLPEVKVVNPFSPFDPATLALYGMVLVIADFCQYWLHRFSHEINILWAGHVTHHSNEEYNLTVAVRQNALEGIYVWIFYMPLAFLGIPWQMFISAYAVSLLWQFLVHTRWVTKLGWLEHVLSTPSHHRVHHGRNPQYIDKNYGAFFIIWDKLFGTFQPEEEEVQYGITSPLKSQNPLWSNIHHHVDILRRVWRAKSLREKMKWMFGVPSRIYDPERQAAVNQPSFTRDPLKKLYVFLNFVLAATAGFYALSTSVELGRWGWFLAVSGAMMVSFSILVALLEQKKWADYAEVIRWIVLMITATWVMQLTVPAGIALLVAGVFMLLFTYLISYLYNKQAGYLNLRQ